MNKLLVLTRTERLILYSVLLSPDWQVQSLFKLSTELQLDYKHAWETVWMLDAAGLLNVVRLPGRDLLLSLAPLPGHLSNGEGENMETEKVETRDYLRPDLTTEEEEKYGKVARKINSVRDDRLRLIYVAALISENVRLVKECNEHRIVRGFEPMPTYDPEKRK